MSTPITLRANASARDRVHDAELYSGEVRILNCDFTAVLGAIPSIASAVWKVSNPSVAGLSSAAINGNVVQLQLGAQTPGECIVRCTATLDSGRQFTEHLRVAVLDAGFSDVFTAGPDTLTAVNNTAISDIVVTTGGGGQILEGGGA